MCPIYIDLHIHTSEDPNNLNQNYNHRVLLDRIAKFTKNSEFMISYTDHNVINKIAYLEAVDLGINILLGAELHIEYDNTKEPYHCHIFFQAEEITASLIDNINTKLEKLYPNKIVSFGDHGIPHIEDIVKAFNDYDIILLPHGGQSHKTFDKAIPAGSIFDSTIEKTIYYNQFDGFTARSNKGLDETRKYFNKLGINEFVNLITCSDNYSPERYPDAKVKEAGEFIPTWMDSSPTFAGLRLSLSESSRLHYGIKPTEWSEYIQKIKLTNELIDINVTLSPGLNVVIGGSSSGKTLFVDSIYRKISNNFEGSNYNNFGIDKIFVQNPSGLLPHYIYQNYIIELVNQTEEKSIDDIDIIRSIFPGDEHLQRRVKENLARFKIDLDELMMSVKEFSQINADLVRIPVFSRLILNKTKITNVFKCFLPKEDDIETMLYDESDYEKHFEYLQEIESFMKGNPFIEYNEAPFNEIKTKLNRACQLSQFEQTLRSIVEKNKDEIDAFLSIEDKEHQTKIENYERLLRLIKEYSDVLYKFYLQLKKITKYNINYKSQKIKSMGHTLYIENDFSINNLVLKDVINKYLKSDCKIDKIENITPYDLLEDNFSKKSPKVYDYNDFINKVYSSLEAANNIYYRIETSQGKDFNSLSAGWKTSILLDLILGYTGDLAPLIIDQPEDNLATSYINNGLIKAIKKIKDKKQIILVSHNATIPMLGDAQTVVLCTNDDNRIKIASDFLEGNLYGKSVVDHVADITDGGKSSIKKRVKKYNLKKFTE